MSAESKAPKYPILDEIEVPQTVIENWQVTIDLLAEIASIPAALIMRVHAHEIEVFLSSHSPGNVYHRGEKAPLDTGLYCETVMSTRRELLVPNSLKDPDWDHNPDIKLGMISYCGLPLTWPNGEVFGTICILDKKDNSYTQQTHHLIERFRDSIQLNLASIYATSLACSQKESADSALRATEVRYRMVFEQSPAGILLIDPATGASVDFNDTAASQLGYTREEFKGLRVSDYEAIEKPEETRARITRILQGGREDFETRHRTKQGDIRNVLVTVQAIQVGGRPLLHTVFRDVTEIRRAEAELARQGRLLEQTQEVAMVGGWELDVASRQLSWTEETYRIHELSPADYAPTLETAINFYAPESRPIITAAVQAGMTEGKEWDLELELITAKERRIWVRAVGKVQFANGRPVQAYGAFQDITERKRAEETLRESHARLQKVLEVETVGVMFWDLTSGCMIDANDTFLNLMGYSRREVEARELTWQKLTPPEYIEVSRAEVTKFLATGRVGPYEKEYFRKDGTRLWFVFAGSSLGGNTCVEFCVDISDRKKAEAELARHRVHLEELVQERTAQLEAANKELEAFTYSVSHDLRAPLRAIEGFSRMLLEGYAQRLDAEGQRLLGVVCANTARMAQLIDDLLAFSRIGRKALEMSAVDMAALARSAVEDIRREKSSPALRVEMGDLPPARGDRAMLGQVFANLIGNAVKYSGKKAAPVVEVGSSREGGETVYFVKDNGAGFDMKYAGKLFGVFQRLHHDDEFEGTGVGLALVERIVRRHGGRVWAEGKVGEGAVFRFTLAAQGGEAL